MVLHGTHNINGTEQKVMVDTNGHMIVNNGSFGHLGTIATKVSSNYENQTLAGANALTIYGSNNGTSIDMNGYKHLTLKIRATATTGLSPLTNLKLYMSLDDADFTLSEQHTIRLYEVPTLTGNYQNTYRVENIGFRYIQLYAHALQGSPTAYYINYSRSN